VTAIVMVVVTIVMVLIITVYQRQIKEIPEWVLSSGRELSQCTVGLTKRKTPTYVHS
jgi:Na+/proline symporter